MNVTTVICNGDGTGLEVTYGDDGTITETTTVTGLPVPPAAPPVVDPLAALIVALDAIGPTATSAQVRTALIAARNNAAQAIPT